MADQSEPVIELVHADVPRSDASSHFPVVRDVDWTIRRGSFWAVGAFAGTGKTDLLLTAGALQRPLGGDVLLFGQRVVDLPEEQLVANRLKVAMVFGNGRLFSHLTISENIALPLEYHGLHQGSEKLVHRALEQSGLTEHADKFPRQIPRSLHQRVALARALALSPEVLLVDNPLEGVDQRNARWWIDFLCAAHVGDSRIGRQLTIVVAVDDFRPWVDTAKQFGVVRDRRFETIGGREEVKTTSESVVRDLLTGAFDHI